MAHIMDECRKLIPCFDPAEIIHSFAGVRAKNSTGDWVVRPAKGQPNFVHAAG
jgi:glycine/D-amino acid oxidase-like deaminating enzyme